MTWASGTRSFSPEERAWKASSTWTRELGCEVAQGYHLGRATAATGRTDLIGRMGAIHHDQVPVYR